jgi:cell wall-associated NlpC family hydrolase
VNGYIRHWELGRVAKVAAAMRECLVKSLTKPGEALLGVAVALLAFVPPALAGPTTWASAEIARVTRVGVLGSSPTGFRQQEPLSEQALATAIAATDNVLHPPQPPASPAPAPAPAPVPPPAQVLSSIPPDATIAGTVTWQIEVPAEDVRQVAFAVDGKQIAVVTQAPFVLPGGLATSTLADGTHQLAAAAMRSDGGTYVAVWNIGSANAPGAAVTALPAQPVAVPVTKAPAPQPTARSTPQPAPAATPVLPQTPSRQLYKPLAPSNPVTIAGLDAALVRYLGLGPAAAEFEQKLAAAGLEAKADAGTEIVARLLGLRFTHPSNQVNLALLPLQSATRAEAAYSFAKVLNLGDGDTQRVQSLADAFSLQSLTTWQRRILTTAVSFIGYPYVWGGTSPTAEAPFGVTAPGGFDCSGFAWRVYKLTNYPDEGNLASVLGGRTTYVMSGEVPHSDRIPARRLQPADALFFGVGPRSSPAQIDHMGIYLGNNWFIQSSGQGVTIVPFTDWYAHSFAWARRPLHEASLE